MHSAKRATTQTRLVSRLRAANPAVLAESRADTVVIAVERRLEPAGGGRAVVIGGLRRNVIRCSVHAPLAVGRPAIAALPVGLVEGVVVRVVEVGVAVVRIVLLGRVRLRLRALPAGLLLPLRRGVGRSVPAALRVVADAPEARLVVEAHSTLGILGQVIGLRCVVVAAERALRLRLLGSSSSLLLALARLVLLAVLLAVVVVVGSAVLVVRRIV